MLHEQAADIMKLGRLDADRAEQPLERQLDQLLGLAHDVGVRVLVAKNASALSRFCALTR